MISRRNLCVHCETVREVIAIRRVRACVVSVCMKRKEGLSVAESHESRHELLQHN